MTATTDPTRARRTGLPVRARIASTVALLVAIALVGAGLIVYVVESRRIEASVQREVEQELGEFAKLERDGIDPRTGEDFADVKALLRTFLRRNVPDDDELLVAWVG
ncbi:MAG TPA: sensor histidine kinase, partial [Nocardioides sp.]|nr:sensor histidine kinase [Nocardioides sp.]